MSDTPTGFRDVGPADALPKRELLRSLEDIFLKYGFVPMEEPSMEFLSVLTAKSGEEVKKEIFKIEGEEVGLKFDQTVGLARYAGTQKSLRTPFKRYIIDRAWRNEEPQRGRYREFLQADVDIVGVREASADLEIIELVKEGLSLFSVQSTILVNNRAFLDAFADKEGFADKKQEVYRVMDKLDKIGRESVEELLSTNKLVDPSVVAPLFEMSLDDVMDYSQDAYEELSFVIEESGATFAPYIIRGFDYYTGNVFEFKEKSGLTIAAGGRYDSLISLYGKDLPAVGAGIGVDRLWALFGKPTNEPYAKLYICTFPSSWKEAYTLAKKLREANIACDINYGNRSLRKQLDYARSLNYRYVVIAGEKELSNNSIMLKDFTTGEEKELSIDQLLEFASSCNR